MSPIDSILASHFVAVVRPEWVADAMPSCVRAPSVAGSADAVEERWVRTRIGELIRASQAILFEASILPAIVGTAAAIHGGAPFRGVPLGLILLSLIGIQAGANLLKGYFEGRDRSSPPSSPGSWFAFDSA